MVMVSRVLARIIFKCCYKNDTPSRGDIFSEVSKTGISFNKREAKVYCYVFLHVLKRERDTCIKHEKNYLKNIYFFSFMRASFMHASR
jgi:hypothetical protein